MAGCRTSPPSKWRGASADDAGVEHGAQHDALRFHLSGVAEGVPQAEGDARQLEAASADGAPGQTIVALGWAVWTVSVRLVPGDSTQSFAAGGHMRGAPPSLAGPVHRSWGGPNRIGYFLIDLRYLRKDSAARGVSFPLPCMTGK